MPLESERLDAVIIGGDLPAEFLGEDVRKQMRLAVGGMAASLRFLREYFRAGRDEAAAKAAYEAGGIPFLSLNGPYLAQFLEGRGFNVRVIPIASWGKAELAQLVAAGPRAVIISTTFLPFAEHIDAIAAVVKRINPTVPVIAGGIQIWKSYRHKLLLDQGAIGEDIRDAVCKHNYLMDPTRPSPVGALVVSASGEETLARMLAGLRDGTGLAGLPNVATFQGGQWVLNPLETDPTHEVKVDWARWAGTSDAVFVPVQAGQGCGLGCEFCDFYGLRHMNWRDAGSIIDELRTIPPVDGVRRVYFTDDNLFTSRKRLRDVCEGIIAADLGLRWRGMLHINIVDDETAALMAASGCLEVHLGIESGDPDILRAMGKRTTPDTILQAIATLARHGINTKSSFIVGFPGETAQTVANTVAMVNAYPTDLPAVHRVLFFRFGVLPLARAATSEARAKTGLRGYGFHWAHNTMTSEEADEHLAAAHDAIKPELSPSYPLEVPELPGMTVDQLKQTFILRTLLARKRRGLAVPMDEAELWDALEEQFAGERVLTGM